MADGIWDMQFEYVEDVRGDQGCEEGQDCGECK